MVKLASDVRDVRNPEASELRARLVDGNQAEPSASSQMTVCKGAYNIARGSSRNMRSAIVPLGGITGSLRSCCRDGQFAQHEGKVQFRVARLEPPLDAGLGAEELAEIIQVDVRTVRRWLSGQTPYARHRAKVARALDTTQSALWPDLATPSPSSGGALAGEPITVFADDPGAVTTQAVVAAADRQIDLLDDRMQELLTEPGVCELLTAKAARGCEIRILTAQPDRSLTPLLATNRIQVRALDHPEPQTIHRIDDEILLLLPLKRERDQPPLTHHLNLRTAPRFFARLIDLYESAWNDAERTIATENDLADYLPGATDVDMADLRTSPPASPALQPNQFTPDPSVARPRRWPRRPSTTT